MPRTYGQHCGLARALDRVGERWTLLIVRELMVAPARYTDLRDALPGMATNLLAERLRAMEEQGIVVRRQLPPPAAATVYELTDLGRGLEEAVNALIRWGGNWMRQPAETDVFRPQWLALAVRALTHPAGAEGLPVRCRVEVDGESFALDITDHGVEVALADARPADVVLATDSRTMLAVASGARPLATAIEEGSARADGDRRAIAAIGRVWQQAEAVAS